MSFLSILKTSFFVYTSAICLAAHAINISPNKLQQEFNDKLTSQAVLQSTKYYARGLHFVPNQKWDLNEVRNNFLLKNYRERSPEQTIMAGDFVVLRAQDCSNLFSLSLLKNSTCFHWKNSLSQYSPAGDGYVIVAHDNVIQSLFKTDPTSAITYAESDPVLVAQFRNNEPLMQIEHKLADFPVQCLNATIAIEDNDFLDHSGISLTGLARAVVKNVVSLRKAQGGSTITQQLVKNYFLTPEKTYTRKAKELYMAIKLESQWSKDEILETYLNVIYMGQNGAFQVRGFGAASQYYFNKPLSQLNLSECALLAAIINNPGLNNPWRKSEKAKARRQLVLSKMRDLKLISENEYKTAVELPLPAQQQLQASETAPYFFDAVKRQAQDLGLPIEGSSFYTTLDLQAQQYAQTAIQNGIKHLAEYKKNIAQKKEKGLELQGVLLAANQNTGFVTVFVGGQSFKQSQFNRALNSKRQIGSLIKPFIYLSGLEYGLSQQSNVTPTTTLIDEPFDWKFDKKNWRPENYDRKFRGEIPYYYALKESLNSPTAQIAYQVGLSKIINLLHQFGLSSNIEELPATSLGSSQHTPLEVLQAYTTIANFGVKQKLTFIQSAYNNLGQKIYTYKSEKLEVSQATQPAVLVGMMKESIRSGTAKAIPQLGFTKPAAGKTGTTSDGKDVWFAGFTPQTTAVVWLGYDQNLKTSLTGGGAAVPIWTNFMKQMTATDSDIDFSWPETTEQKTIESKIDNKAIELIFAK